MAFPDDVRAATPLLPLLQLLQLQGTVPPHLSGPAGRRTCADMEVRALHLHLHYHHATQRHDPGGSVTPVD